MVSRLDSVISLGSAGSALRRAVVLRPSSGESHRDLGIVLLRKDKFDAAIAELRLGIATTYNQTGNTIGMLRRICGPTGPP